MRLTRTDIARNLGFVIATAAFVCGCYPTDNMGIENNERKSDSDFQAQLVDTAHDLADQEIARLSAIELLYRNQTKRQETILPVIGSHVGVIIKMYREFTGYEIVDILRTNSMLHPIEIVVRYDFDVLATKVRGLDSPDAMEITDNDHDFHVLWTGDFTVHYKCDSDGVPAGDSVELAPVNYYKRELGTTKANRGSPPSVTWTSPPSAPTVP